MTGRSRSGLAAPVFSEAAVHSSQKSRGVVEVHNALLRSLCVGGRGRALWRVLAGAQTVVSVTALVGRVGGGLARV